MANSSVLRLLLARLLSLTNGESVEVVTLRSSLRITSEVFNALLQQIIDEGLVSIKDSSISLDLDERLNLAMRAIEVGADPESISRSLGWLEFEELSARVFEKNGFRVLRRFRFTAEGRRWEMDLLAIRVPYIVCGECKRWEKGIGNRTARVIVETHLEKTEVFTKHSEDFRKRIGISSWSKVFIIPMTLTLSATPMKIYRRVPSVSVLALPRFINEFDGQLERLAHFKVELKPLEPEKKQTVFRKRVSGSKRSRRL